MYKEEITELLKTKPEAWKAINGDGHGIYYPHFYTELGFPVEFIEKITTTEKSDGTYKGTIFGPDGNIVPEMVGVYSLYFHESIADMFDITEHDHMNGRGFRAQAVRDALRKQFGL
jgi:hypothetical protein